MMTSDTMFFGTLIFLAVAILLATFIYSRRLERQIQQEGKTNVKKTVDGILRDRQMEGRWRWVDERDDVIQYVHSILGTVPGERLIWARVTMRKTRTSIAIECDYRIDIASLTFADQLADEIRKRGYEVLVVVSAPQPREDEIGVPFKQYED